MATKWLVLTVDDEVEARFESDQLRHEGNFSLTQISSNISDGG